MLVMFNILFIIYYYLFIMFNIFIRKNNYLFVFLKNLVPVYEINYLVLKIYFMKILCKKWHVWSCFEVLIIRKIIVQSKFNLDVRFNSYNIF